VGSGPGRFWAISAQERQFEREIVFPKNCSKFPGLAISGRHNSAMITDHRNFRPNGPSTGCLVYNFTIQSLSPGMYIPYKKGTCPNFWQSPMSDIALSQ